MNQNYISPEIMDKIKSKPTLSVNDIQTILTCGKNVAYRTVDDALKDHSFAVKKIGKKYYIPAESFWLWFNTSSSF